ncbi:MAG: hypothetical protein ABI662_08655, partial [Dermatophilaceae bacterium]
AALSEAALSETALSETALIGRSNPTHHASDPELLGVAHLVHQEFDGRIDARAIDECLERVAARFIGAKVRSFVPLLVNRYVREELKASLQTTRSDVPRHPAREPSWPTPHIALIAPTDPPRP